MAAIVGAIGVPHSPSFPDLVAREGPTSETARLFETVRSHVEAVAPDVIVIFSSDHLNAFFLDNLPTFCIGVAERTEGPNDSTPGLPRCQVPVDEDLASHIHDSGLAGGFDLAQSQKFELDHSVLVPLHFLTPDMRVPIVPVFLNGLVPPLPAAGRCRALGALVRTAVADWQPDRRVMLMASGSFSLEVGGPKITPGSMVGVPDPQWADRVLRHLALSQVDDLVGEATAQRMASAGNVGGELLNWIALLGALGAHRPAFLEPQRAMGHAYAAWRFD